MLLPNGVQMVEIATKQNVRNSLRLIFSYRQDKERKDEGYVTTDRHVIEEGNVGCYFQENPSSKKGEFVLQIKNKKFVLLRNLGSEEHVAIANVNLNLLLSKNYGRIPYKTIVLDFSLERYVCTIENSKHNGEYALCLSVEYSDIDLNHKDIVNNKTLVFTKNYYGYHMSGDKCCGMGFDNTSKTYFEIIKGKEITQEHKTLTCRNVLMYGNSEDFIEKDAVSLIAENVFNVEEPKQPIKVGPLLKEPYRSECKVKNEIKLAQPKAITSSPKHPKIKVVEKPNVKTEESVKEVIERKQNEEKPSIRTSISVSRVLKTVNGNNTVLPRKKRK